MASVAVIGGGFWGVCAALEATERGHDVTLIDDCSPVGASRNAAGIVCEHWYNQETSKKMFPPTWQHPPREVRYGMEWLEERCGLRLTGEWFATYKQPKLRFRKDCYLIESPMKVLTLFPTTVLAHVERLIPDDPVGWVIETTQGDVLAAQKVILAAGAGTDAILGRSHMPELDVRPLRGRALIARMPEAFRREFDGVPITVMVRPYTHLTLRQFPAPGYLRLGDTVERSGSVEQEHKWSIAVRNLADELAPGAGDPEAEIDWVEGLRPLSKRYITEEVAKNLAVATGGHRVGLALAPPAARRVCDLLEL